MQINSRDEDKGSRAVDLFSIHTTRRSGYVHAANICVGFGFERAGKKRAKITDLLGRNE